MKKEELKEEELEQVSGGYDNTKKKKIVTMKEEIVISDSELEMVSGGTFNSIKRQEIEIKNLPSNK